MRRLISIAVLTSLISLDCGDGGMDGDLPREYRTIEVPYAWLTSEEARTRGRTLFQGNCALCHGERGNGHGLRREGLRRPVLWISSFRSVSKGASRFQGGRPAPAHA